MKARNEGKSGGLPLKPISIGAVIAVMIGALCMVLSAVLMTALDIPHAALSVLAVVSVAVGAFFGGLVAARLSGSQGWLTGLLCGLFLFACVLLAGLLLHRGIDVGFLFIKLPVLLVSGMAGGMMGVNKK